MFRDLIPLLADRHHEMAVILRGMTAAELTSLITGSSRT